MPNIMTHALCANDMLQDYPENTLLKVIQAHPRLYSCASSGPDFLFYYKAYPFQDAIAAKQIHEIGEQVHRREINAFYQEAVKLIIHQTDAAIKDQWIAYLAGHLTHWALDSIAHPFVFHLSGEMKGKTQYWHYRFESMMDTLMVKKIKGLVLEKNPSNLMVTLNKHEIRAASSLYQQVTNHVYQQDFPTEVFEQSFRDTASISKWLFDPKTRLFPLVQIIEKGLGVDWKFSSHMIIGDIDEEHDVLNLKHANWSHPCDPLNSSNESFLDLYDRAILRGREALVALHAIVYESADIQILLDVLKNQSYDTGLDHLQAMVNYQSVYEKNA